MLIDHTLPGFSPWPPPRTARTLPIARPQVAAAPAPVPSAGGFNLRAELAAGPSDRLPLISIEFVTWGGDVNGKQYAKGSLAEFLQNRTEEIPVVVGHKFSPFWCVAEDVECIEETDQGARAVIQPKNSPIAKLLVSAMRQGHFLKASPCAWYDEVQGTQIVKARLQEISILEKPANPATRSRIIEPTDRLGLPISRAAEKLAKCLRFPAACEESEEAFRRICESA